LTAVHEIGDRVLEHLAGRLNRRVDGAAVFSTATDDRQRQ
jgi:GGDEF domain-containing protein